jgi:hypothetical protein
MRQRSKPDSLYYKAGFVFEAGFLLGNPIQRSMELPSQAAAYSPQICGDYTGYSPHTRLQSGKITS